MQKLHGRPDRERMIIIVAPPDAMVRVVRRSSDHEPIAFTSLDEFDAWAEVHGQEASTIRRHVAAALEQIGCVPGALPRRLRLLVESIGDRPRTPRLRDLEHQWPSRRSFYRNWGAEISEPPSTFLRRVRNLHARRLLAEGLTKKRAAEVAGFTSVDQMQRHLRR